MDGAARQHGVGGLAGAVIYSIQWNPKQAFKKGG